MLGVGRPRPPLDGRAGVHGGQLDLGAHGQPVEHRRPVRGRLGEHDGEADGAPALHSKPGPRRIALVALRSPPPQPPDRCPGEARVEAGRLRGQQRVLLGRGPVRAAATTRPPAAPRGRRIGARRPRRARRGRPQRQRRSRVARDAPPLRARRELRVPDRATARAARSRAARRAPGTRAAAQPAGPMPGSRACGRARAHGPRCHHRQRTGAVPTGRSPRSPRTTCRSADRVRRAPLDRARRWNGRRGTRTASPSEPPVRRQARDGRFRGARLRGDRSSRSRRPRCRARSGVDPGQPRASPAMRGRRRPSARDTAPWRPRGRH